MVMTEQMWHMQDSHGQILALASRGKSLKSYKLPPFRSERERGREREGWREGASERQRERARERVREGDRTGGRGRNLVLFHSQARVLELGVPAPSRNALVGLRTY